MVSVGPACNSPPSWAGGSTWRPRGWGAHLRPLSLSSLRVHVPCSTWVWLGDLGVDLYFRCLKLARTGLHTVWSFIDFYLIVLLPLIMLQQITETEAYLLLSWTQTNQ